MYLHRAKHRTKTKGPSAKNLAISKGSSASSETPYVLFEKDRSGLTIRMRVMAVWSLLLCFHVILRVRMRLISRSCCRWVFTFKKNPLAVFWVLRQQSSARDTLPFSFALRPFLNRKLHFHLRHTSLALYCVSCPSNEKWENYLIFAFSFDDLHP